MSQRNNPERYSRQGNNDPQEQYSQGRRKWGGLRAGRAGGDDSGEMPRIASVSSVTALPTPRSASLTNAASPAERLAAARYAAAPALPQRLPDDAPALSPARKLGNALQRFSGTGVASVSAVQRQEQRARIITLSLVSVAVALVVVSAFLLFNPTVRHVGFGLTPGNRVVTVTSTAAVTVFQTPTPQHATPTPAPGSQPGATPTPRPTATLQPTATPRPTATPLPTLTPTPTPIPFGAGATVTFTATSQSLSTAGEGNITACPGCGGNEIGDTPIGPQTLGFSEQGNAAPDGYIYTYSGSVTFYIDTTNCQDQFNCGAIADATATYGDGTPCFSVRVSVNFNRPPKTVSCNQNSSSNAIYVSLANQNGTGAVAYDAPSLKVASTTALYVVTQAACHATLVDDDNRGTSWANGVLQATGQNVVASSITHGGYGCNPGVGNVETYTSVFTGSSNTTVSGLAYNPPDAQAQALQRINGLKPAGYSWKAGSPQGCSPNVGPISGNSIAITCVDTGTAIYDWPSSLQAQLANSLVSSGANRVTQAQAQSICNSTQGVASGSCSVVIDKGSYMPTSGSTIQIVINIP